MIPVTGKKKLNLFLHHIRVFLFGTGEYEKEWRERGITAPEPGDWGEKDQDWIQGYWASGSHPHREFLVQKIVDLKPSSVLEIGCNCGPNLRILAEKLPGTRFIGIDINADSVRKGNEWMEADGITNVHLELGSADDLSKFPDGSFDVVFTDAVLLYIGTDKIEEVLRGFLRVAGKYIVLCEWDIPQSGKPTRQNPKGKFLFRRGLWAYDFSTIFTQLAPDLRVNKIRLPEDLWEDEIWQKYGTVILAEHRNN